MKNNLLFLLTLLFILISISYGISRSSTTTTLKEDNFIKEIKKLSYYNKHNLNRYITYKNNNQNLTSTEIITYVNIGLDNKPYTNVKNITSPTKTNILVNKYNTLSPTYEPVLIKLNEKYARPNMYLTKEAAKSFEELSETASSNGLTIKAMSTYRSYSYQETLYNNYYSKDKEYADTYSARPGHSEHQTALAVDVYNEQLSYIDFDKTKEFTWMKENAHNYGFILRYPKDKEHITLYSYEPWHYRYVGKKIATYIYNNNITYDEYYVRFVENKKE